MKKDRSHPNLLNFEDKSSSNTPPKVQSDSDREHFSQHVQRLKKNRNGGNML
jgi:hypothetical protein